MNIGVEVENIKMETTEIQADTVEAFAMHSAKETSDKLKCTALKNDTGLYVEALNGSICLLWIWKRTCNFLISSKRKIAETKSGTYGWSWDFIFIPDGYDKTIGNYPDQERCRVWNTDSYTKLVNYKKDKKIY